MMPLEDQVSRRRLRVLRNWFDTGACADPVSVEAADRIDWLRTVPFIAMHLACLGVFWVWVSPVAL
jgi:stearoyl-CoA desaturase (delta-9 desaturase)